MVRHNVDWGRFCFVAITITSPFDKNRSRIPAVAV